MNWDQRGSATAPISTQSQDPTPISSRPANLGACSCEPPTAFKDCTCNWGKLIRELLFVGYGQPVADAAHGLLELSSVARDVILDQRETVYRRLAAAFQGNVIQFCVKHGISRAVFYRLGLRIKNQ